MSYVDAKSTEASSLPSVCRSRIYIHMLSLYLDSLSSTPKCPNGTLSSFLLSVFCLFLSFSSPSSHGWLVRDTSLPWVTACGCRNAQHPSLSPFVCVCVFFLFTKSHTRSNFSYKGDFDLHEGVCGRGLGRQRQLMLIQAVSGLDWTWQCGKLSVGASKFRKRRSDLNVEMQSARGS